MIILHSIISNASMTQQGINSINFAIRIGKILLILPVIILYIHYFFPQRWGFFILKPRSAGLNIYPIHAGKAENNSIVHNNMSYGIGISRKGRYLYKELSRLIDENKSLSWQPFPDSQTIPVNGSTYTQIPLNRYGFEPGKYLLTKTQTVPDSFLINNKKIISARQYSLAEIR